ncbi:hypothetical protein [Solirhodobacter olei]|uniref:hypothetical protein n=1 Tax=Solirhodobacter olei TaxID=2493082 RepID=UPI000FDB05F4|nr:hypothetical protein [Solirhodobacter olei]
MAADAQYQKAADLRQRFEAELDAMAKARADERGEDYYDAYHAVCQTERGRQTLVAADLAARLQAQLRPGPTD